MESTGSQTLLQAPFTKCSQLFVINSLYEMFVWISRQSGGWVLEKVGHSGNVSY